ncbi:predicted protein [Lichtheimia corymbifera JMRC:FSU:9682]|uniref:Endoplasmic reticulum junction formation protein lunapark n=1 Tax=Lichtheimia corymbifera JMRC:FSU:9682 TaxID=1263082 RepID=A0A068RKZ8_9FUNG|nr:predicted protein [Lichtheimia corymbifera JMRC:FSU:9682]
MNELLFIDEQTPSYPRLDTFQQALTHLEDDIDNTTNELLRLDRHSRRMQVLLMLYSGIVWIVYVGYCFFALRDAHWDTITLVATPAIVSPLCIRYGQRLVEWWFKQHQGQARVKLAWLRARYDSKLNELKAKVPSDHPLLELYQTPSQRPGHHALICNFCFAYNGLASHPQSTQYVCPKCLKFNTTHDAQDTGMIKEEGSIASRVKRRRLKSR